MRHIRNNKNIIERLIDALKKKEKVHICKSVNLERININAMTGYVLSIEIGPFQADIILQEDIGRGIVNR